MTNQQLDAKAIFSVARNIESAEAREEYLNQVCGTRRDLLERVTKLLRGYEQCKSLLESPLSDAIAPTLDVAPIAVQESLA